MEKDIVIVSCDLTNSREDVFKAFDDDSILTETILEYVRELKKHNIEIWEHSGNIIITEKGYYLAIFIENIKEIVKKQE